MGNFSNLITWGHLVVHITVEHPEEWLNKILQKELKVWNIKRINPTTLELSIGIRDFRTIRPFLRQTQAKVHIVKKNGLAFLVRESLKRKGFYFGLIASLIIIFILSNILFSIQIKGADPELELKINETLKKNQIHLGMFSPLIAKNAELEKILSKSLQNVTWVGVSKSGTSLKIQVVQKNLPKKEKILGPGNLIAAKKAMIQNIFTEKGLTVVKKYQWVNKGDLLVSGQIGTEKKPVWVAAKGKIIGETWYRSFVEVPYTRNTIQIKPGGNYHIKLMLFQVAIPIWKNGTPLKNPKLCHSESSVFYFLSWRLPFEIKRVQCYKTVENPVTYTQAIAKKQAEEISDLQLMNKLPDKSKIISRKLDKVTSKDGKWTYAFHYVVQENIAQRQSLGGG